MSNTIVTDLRVEQLREPLGVEAPAPRLSWRLESPRRDVRQTAYRVVVAATREDAESGRGDIWDSGRVDSAATLGVLVEGAVLVSRQRCWWRVQVWDDAGAESVSPLSWWEMGLLESSDWVADWLAAEDETQRADREAGLHWIWKGKAETTERRLFRHEFTLEEETTSGSLLVVINDSAWSTQILGVWVDGEQRGGTEEPVDAMNASLLGSSAFQELGAQSIELGRLIPGRHVVATEVLAYGDAGPVVYGQMPDEPPTYGRIPAVAIFARLTAEGAEPTRIVSGPSTKTRVGAEPGWQAVDYDDSSWDRAEAARYAEYQPWPTEPALRFRREFDVPAGVVAARLFATALGAYEASINGRPASDSLLSPEISQFEKRVRYQVADVTDLIVPGRNAIGITVADGWFASGGGRFAWMPGPRRLIAQLELALDDGSRVVIGTGPDWRVGASPIVSSSVKGGEVHDRRLDEPGWDTAGFDDATWATPLPAAPPDVRVTSSKSPPVRTTATYPPHTIRTVRPGVHVVDFAEYFTGWCRMRATGLAGTRITLSYAERITEAGDLDLTGQQDPVGLPHRDTFVLRGDPGGEVLEPTFAFRSFRYVAIEGPDAAPELDDLTGVFIHSDLSITGRIESDSSLIEQLWRNTLQSQRSTVVAIPTDNNLREGRGWLGDAGTVWDTFAFNMDVATFTARFVEDVVDHQAESGSVPMTAPEPLHNSALYSSPGSAPAWGDAIVILPWTIWQRYGDLGIIERSWSAMRRYVQFIHDVNPDLIWRNGRSADFGDWIERAMTDPDERSTPRVLFATAYWVHSLDLLAQMASAIGRAADAAELDALASDVRQAFRREFVQPDGTVGTGTQTCHVLAIAFDLIPDDQKPAAIERLVADIRDHGTSLTTGIHGTQFVLDVLTDAGHADAAYDLLLRTEHPSWGYAVEHGATGIWEAWDGKGGSLNQPGFGSFGGFLFRRMAGIAPAVPGFERILIRPVFDDRLARGGAEYDSVRGRISTAWTRSGGVVRLEVSIPANTAAAIHLPVADPALITEGGVPVAMGNGIHSVIPGLDTTIIETGSGSYRYEFPDRPGR